MNNIIEFDGKKYNLKELTEEELFNLKNEIENKKNILKKQIEKDCAVESGE